MENMYGPFLLKTYTKCLVLAICIGFTVNGIYSIFVIGNEFDPNGFVPGKSHFSSNFFCLQDTTIATTIRAMHVSKLTLLPRLSAATIDGSYILTYNSINTRYFASEGGPIVWGVISDATGFEIEAVQEDYFILQEAFETSLYAPGTSNFWLRDFVAYTEALGLEVSESDDFYTYVTAEGCVWCCVNVLLQRKSSHACLCFG
jgi:hypothetical protein